MEKGSCEGAETGDSLTPLLVGVVARFSSLLSRRRQGYRNFRLLRACRLAGIRHTRIRKYTVRRVNAKLELERTDVCACMHLQSLLAMQLSAPLLERVLVGSRYANIDDEMFASLKNNTYYAVIFVRSSFLRYYVLL